MRFIERWGLLAVADALDRLLLAFAVGGLVSLWNIDEARLPGIALDFDVVGRIAGTRAFVPIRLLGHGSPSARLALGRPHFLHILLAERLRLNAY